MTIGAGSSLFGDPYALRNDEWTRADSAGRTIADKYAAEVVERLEKLILDTGLPADAAATARMAALRLLSRRIAEAE